MLLGPNGAGKTTAIRVITGALEPDAGHVRTFGWDPARYGEQVRIRCGVVSAKPALYDRLTGWDNMQYSAELYGLGRNATDKIREAAGRFGIVDALDQQVGGYSTGMKTRLALARSVLHDPELLLFDEPTSGLDPESSKAVLDLIREMTADGHTVVMCTHLLIEAEGLADQIIVLESGTDLLHGSQEELIRRYWPNQLVWFDAEDPARPRRSSASMDGVLAHAPQRPAGSPRCRSTTSRRVPDLVGALTAAGVRLTQGRPAPTDPRRALLRRPQGTARASAWRPRCDHDRSPRPRHRRPTPPSAGTVPRKNRFNWSRMWVVARTDLRSCSVQRDFWVPDGAARQLLLRDRPGLPARRDRRHRQQRRRAGRRPGGAGAARRRPRTRSPRSSPIGQVQYMIAVYLLAPIAVVVPLTISSAIGASTIVGERERGTGEFLAHSPADTREIYIGKLLASIIPGYLTTVVGFGIYSLLVNLIVGPEGRLLVLPHHVVVAAHRVGAAAVPGHHPVARAAPVEPGQEHRRGAAGHRPGHAAADPHRLRPVDRRPGQRRHHGQPRHRR